MPDPADADQNHEAVVEDFFNTLDAEESGSEVESTPEVPEAVAAPETAAETPDEQDGGEDEDEESEEEAPDAPDEPEVELTEVQVLENRLRDMQSIKDQQLAEVNTQLAQMQQWAQTVYEQQLAAAQAQTQAQQHAAQQRQAPIQNVSREQLEGAVEQNVVSAFQWTVANRPDLVGTTIAIAREKHGHQVADEMQLEYNQYQLQNQRQEYEAREQAREQAQQDAEAPAQIRETMSQIVDSVANQYGDKFADIQDDFRERAIHNVPLFKQYMEQNGYEMTPDAVRSFLVQTVNDIREERINAQAAKPRKPRAVKPSEHVERSTSGTRPEDMSADDAAINELLQGARFLEMDITPAPNG